MKRVVQFAGACMIALAVSACAGDDGTSRAADGTAGTAGATGTSGRSADVDRDFVLEQLAMGEKEIKLGRLAQERGGTPEVRAYGEMMVADHTKAGDELRQIASRHNITLPSDKKDDKNEGHDAHEKLSKLSGAQFDRAYLEMMTDDHDEGIDDVRKKAESTSEHADVKGWAMKSISAMQKHLDRAKEIRQQLDRANQR